MPWWTCFNCINLKNPDDVLTLDFSHCLLYDVPPDVFQYERTLEELHLDSNRINDLPRQLFYCHELKRLYLNDNEIGEIPPAIGSLINLQSINLSRNALTTVAEQIKSCKHLVRLDLSVNSLERLPDAITSLIALQELYLNDTFLEFLPANFGRLTNLRILELRDNNLMTLPKSIARLVNLSRIDIGNNEFTELPEVIGQLVNLTELWIDNNRIRRISSNVDNLRKLVHFEASNNLLTQLPNECCNWSKLQELSVSSNELEQLPSALGDMKSLIALKVDENQLQELPDSISQLECLEELMVSHNDLFRLPQSIGLLRKLRFLTADENFLRNLPNEICSCINLTILSVRGNKLTSIPQDIGHLLNLKVINVVNNFLTYLPVSLLNLTQLSALWISDNQGQPLMPLQKEFGAGQIVHLTCYLLPQNVASTMNRESPDDKDDNEVVTPAHTAHQAVMIDSMMGKRRICFASDPVVTVEQNGRLMRSPTPYPKELRVLAKYAKNVHKTNFTEYDHADGIQETKNPETSVEIKEALVTTNPSMKLNSNGNYCGIEQEPLLNQPHPPYSHNPADIHLMLQSPSMQTDETDGAQASDYFYVQKPPPQTMPITNYENINHCSNLYAPHPSNSKSESTLSLSNQFDQQYAVKELPSGLRTSVTNSLISENFNVSDADPLNVNYQSCHLPRSPQCFITTNSPIDHQQPPHHQGYVMYPMQLQHSLQPDHHYHVQRAMEPIYYTKNNQPQEPTWPSRIPANSNNGLAKLPTHIETNRPSAMKPPPYVYAKNFTRMTPNDLMLYESFRNKTLNNGDAHDVSSVTNGHDNGYNGCNDSNENGLQTRSSNGADSNQNRESDADEEDVIGDVESTMNKNVDEDQNQTNGKQFGARTDDTGTMNISKSVRSGKPWMFGVHKNPKVMQLSLPKESEIGFKLTELQNEGIFVGEVSNASAASRLLKKMDKILDIDGVDFTSISLKEATTVLSNAGPILNIMLSRI
ncbi:hypothetical protein HA402_009117 [Bradysia odoriphaga]|nr:hypothetical protein HA402_009117 [Bradysia odoriphaga]